MNAPTADPLPSISVIICTRNRPETLGRAVESVLAQDYPSFEVLVLDQSGDERSEVVVRGLGQRSSVLRYVRLVERGLSRAYNRGVAETSHELVAFTDDDCAAPAGWLRAVASAFREHPDVGLLYGQVLEPLEQGGRGGDGVIPSLPIPRIERLSRKDGFRVFGMGANFAARRSVMLRLGGFDEVLGGGGPLQSAQDFDFAYRLFRDGGVILLDPRVVVRHYGYRSKVDWPATVGSYGVGVGGFYFKHVRAGDAYAALLLTRDLVGGGIRLLKRFLLAQPTRQYRTYLGHMVAGVWQSRVYPIDRRLRLYRLPTSGGR